MSLSTIDNDQYVQIGKIWQEISALKSKDVSLQSQVISNNKALNELADSLQALDTRVRTEINDLKVFANDVKAAFTKATQVDNFLIDEVVNINQRVSEIVTSNNLSDPNPSGTGSLPPRIPLPEFKFPDLGSFLPGVGTGALIAGTAVLAFLLLSRRGR